MHIDAFVVLKWDVLVLENYVMLKDDQPIQNDDESWLNEFELD